jgi:hypothetical protein
VSIAAGAGEENILTRLIQAMVTREYVDTIIWVYRGVGTHIYPLGMTGNAVPNIITDWTLLFLTMPYIWRLHKKTT